MWHTFDLCDKTALRFRFSVTVHKRPVLARAIPHLHFPTYSYLLISFTFPFFFFLLASSIFFSIPLIPLYFQAGCRRRRLNLALVFMLILCYNVLFSLECMLVFVEFDLVLSCGVTAVSLL